MSQNISHAVMAQRHEALDSLDWFGTPAWATRALCTHVLSNPIRNSVWEPACGDGSMVRPLREHFARVVASDVHDYGWDHRLHDFLQPYVPAGTGDIDFVITNPPYKLCEQFVDRALSVANVGVAMFVRSVFIEGRGRYERLFSRTPPAIMAQFCERVPLNRGAPKKDATTATAYCWLVWLRSNAPDLTQTRLVWIPPCRAYLERDSDYEAMA